MKNKLTKFLAVSAAASVLTPAQVLACACGCSLLDVGTSSLLPSKQGGMLFAQYDNIVQDHNWHNDSKAANDDNADKKIDTQIITLGGQYMFNRKWGLMARVPYVQRDIKAIDSADGHDHEHEDEVATTSTTKHYSLGDVKLMGIYSGFFEDMSTGLTFGLKLPTGSHKQGNFERDMQIGTGSTDVMLGFYHRGQIVKGTSFGWFTQGSWQKAVIADKDFIPGNEVNLSIGSYYSGLFVSNVNISPMLQFIGTHKSRNHGLQTNSDNSGYDRVFIAPGVEVNFGKFKIYSDIELPIYSYTNGNQLTAARIFKVILGYNF